MAEANTHHYARVIANQIKNLMAQGKNGRLVNFIGGVHLTSDRSSGWNHLISVPQILSGQGTNSDNLVLTGGQNYYHGLGVIDPFDQILLARGDTSSRRWDINPPRDYGLSLYRCGTNTGRSVQAEK